MARVSDEQVREYQGYTAQLFEGVFEALLEIFLGIDISDPENRRYVADTAVHNFGHYASFSSDLGRAWYQQCRDTQSDGKNPYVARAYINDDDYRKLTNDVYSVLDKVYDEKKTAEEGCEELAQYVANYVQKANRDTVIENLNIENAGVESAPGTPTRVEQRKELRRYKGGNVTYMRVPSADCHCAFCLMMASRGAVYKTLESAGGGGDENKYHLHCRCSVVPVPKNDPLIEGYSTDDYEDMYYGAREKWEHKDYSEDVAKRIERGKANAAKHDREWRDINEIEIVMRDMYELH